MVWIRNVFFAVVIALLSTSCADSKSNVPNSTGRGSEIVVVGNKIKWDGSVGDSIRKALMGNMVGLPEAEPEFSLIFIPEQSFNKYLQTHRNILFIDIQPVNLKSKVETMKNVWSHPQRVIKIFAGSDTAFTTLFSKHSESIKELFNQNERARYSAQNALNRNTAVEKSLVDEFGINMMLSKDFYLAKKMTDFIWLRAETNANSIGLMIYTFPYRDTSQLTPLSVIATRDRYTKLYIPGSLTGSYMTTETKFYTPESRKLIFKQQFALETRGLWKTYGDFMGGPFVNYTIVDAPRQRIIVFDGYVYYPNKSKRNYIRQLEAIIWGAEFTSPKR
jgi:hypothetical protein